MERIKELPAALAAAGLNERFGYWFRCRDAGGRIQWLGYSPPEESKPLPVSFSMSFVYMYGWVGLSNTAIMLQLCCACGKKGGLILKGIKCCKNTLVPV